MSSTLTDILSSSISEFTASPTPTSTITTDTSSEPVASHWLSPKQGLIIGICGVIAITISMVYLSKYTTRGRRATNMAAQLVHIRHTTIEMEPRRMHHKLPLLPDHALQKLHTETITQTPEEADVCAICLADIACQDVIMQLPCHHQFHYECIRKWLTTKSEQCPLCKGSVLAALGIKVDSPRDSMEQDNGEAVSAEQSASGARERTQTEITVPERAAARNV